MATLMQKDVLLEAVAIATAKISKSYEKIDETQRINDRVLISKNKTTIIQPMKIYLIMTVRFFYKKILMPTEIMNNIEDYLVSYYTFN